MSEQYTAIFLPGVGGGIASLERRTADEMLAEYRRYAVRQIVELRQVLAAMDEEFRIYQHRGVHRQRDVRVLQEGRIEAEIKKAHRNGLEAKNDREDTKP